MSKHYNELLSIVKALLDFVNISIYGDESSSNNSRDKRSCFYDESGMVLGFTTVPMPPLSSEMLTVGDYVSAGYGGYAIISADIPISITVDTGPGALLLASFDANPLSGSAPLTVNFANTSSGYDASFWSFGDVVTSTLDSPTYTYTFSGTYTVMLTVSKNGCLETTPQFNPTASAIIQVKDSDSMLYLPVVLSE